MVAVPPRSTRSHCGSLQALPHRVVALPSTAAAAGAPPFSVEEASAGRPCESSESAACAASTPTIARVPASAATTAEAMIARVLRLACGRAWSRAVDSVFTRISTVLHGDGGTHPPGAGNTGRRLGERFPSLRLDTTHVNAAG